MNWTPTFAYKTFLSDVQIEHIQRVVDCLDLSDFDKPNFDVFGCCYKHPMTMVLRLAQNLVEEKCIATKFLEIIQRISSTSKTYGRLPVHNYALEK